MEVDDKGSEDIVRRLKSVEGHVRGIQRMVAEGQYCIDIINQTAAVRAALDSVDALILDRHLHSCVTTALQSNDPAERDRVLGELVAVFQGSKRVMSEEQ